MTRRQPPIAVLYEHPEWFEPLFAALERRRLPVRRVDLRAAGAGLDPAAPPPPCALLLNRMSPSAHIRGLPGAVEAARALVGHYERAGVRVLNGSRAFGLEASKAAQISLLASLGIPHPASRAIHRPEEAPAAASRLRFPVLVKANVGGSGAGIRRFDDPEALAAAVEAGELDLGPDGTALVQEFVPRRDGTVVRIETLGGRFLYAIRIRAGLDRFQLCPAGLTGEDGDEGACLPAAGPGCPTEGRVEVEAYRPPPEAVEAAEWIARAGGLDLAGVEYLVDDRDGTRRFYDINALSNFVRDGRRRLGFDPFDRLAAWLEEEAYGETNAKEAPAGGRVRVDGAGPARGADTGAAGEGRPGIRYGYWLPVFGGWLRNVEDEGMEASWEYVRDLALRSERIGFDLTLIAELFLNDIKEAGAPSLDAWTTAAALAAVTRRLELMVAVRPTYHLPAVLAKQAANIDRIAGGRLSLNLVASWWEAEARAYGAPFDRHGERYARASEWIRIVKGLWAEPRFDFRGRYHSVEGAVLEPKPVPPSAAGAPRSTPGPVVYAGGESEAGKEMISGLCDAYVMHGDPPHRVREKIEDMRRRRAREGLPPMRYGVSGFVVVRETEEGVRRELERIAGAPADAAAYHSFQDWVDGTELEHALRPEDYAVSNRGLHSGLVGTPERVAARIDEFEEAGADLLLLQFSPQAEEMERFAETVIARRGTVAV